MCVPDVSSWLGTSSKSKVLSKDKTAFHFCPLDFLRNRCIESLTCVATLASLIFFLGDNSVVSWAKFSCLTFLHSLVIAFMWCKNGFTHLTPPQVHSTAKSQSLVSLLYLQAGRLEKGEKRWKKNRNMGQVSSKLNATWSISLSFIKLNAKKKEPRRSSYSRSLPFREIKFIPSLHPSASEAG